MKYIVTSYHQPDMDGVSCMYAYAEYLRNIGKEASYYIYGTPKKEVQIVTNLFQIVLDPISQKEAENQKYILTDTNLMKHVPSFIDSKNIVEIIDHHDFKRNDLSPFENAKIQIEQVGAAATLVVERFMESNMGISKESATLLYYGIISNTINLKSSVTTSRDIEAINWLMTKGIDTTRVLEIFKEKSNISDNLAAEMEVHLEHTLGGKRILIGQIEITQVEEFLKKYEKEMHEILQKVYQEKQLDYLFVNCVDIYEGYSTLLAFNKETATFLEELIQRPMQESNNKLETITMRKQWWKKIEEFMQ